MSDRESESCRLRRDEGFVVRSDDGQRSGFGGKRMSDRESESCRLRRDEGFVVRSDDGQHRICLVCGEAAALPNALGGHGPTPPSCGQKPTPTFSYDWRKT